MKVRLRFVKLGKVRWTSHRDVAHMWERALRRLELPVAYTERFSPRPKLSFGLALSTGHESMAEYLDVRPSQRAYALQVGAVADDHQPAAWQGPKRLDDHRDLLVRHEP